MRLKYNCEFCGYSEIQHFRDQVIGEPYISGTSNRETVNFRCPECGCTRWGVNRRFSIGERLYLGVYQQVADTLGKIGVKEYVFEKGVSTDEWLLNRQEISQ